MKNFYTSLFFTIATITMQSQSLGYQDLGLLFSGNDNNGSARFVGMSGAFGAVGGDISAMNINPAGIAVYNNSSFSGSIGTRNTATTSNYYNNAITTDEAFFNASQAGAVFVFESLNNSKWSKFAVGFNYRITKDFNHGFSAGGNSGIATFTDFPIDQNTPRLVYDISEEQRFRSTMNGELSEINIAFSSVHENKLYAGVGLNFYDLNFNQETLLTEFNNTADDQELDVDLYQVNNTIGTGFSLNFGVLYKAHQFFRLGLAYQTSTWFTEILQDTNYGFDSENNIDVGFFQGETTFFAEDQSPYTEANDWQYIAYRLKTPSNLTASAAFIFGKIGLLSIDYTNKNYQNIKLLNGYFLNENQFYKNKLRATHNVKIGSEWRMQRLSVRAGYQFEQSPLKNASNLENTTGYSFGGGYLFGNTKLDLSYSKSSQNTTYDFYSQFSNISAANLTNNNSKIMATLTLNL